MNNNQLQNQPQAISTMASGARKDAWHWREADLSLFSGEKLNSILSLPVDEACPDELAALAKVRKELLRRAEHLKTR